MSGVLLCATDAGGANNLASLNPAIERQRLSAVLVTSARHLSLFEPLRRYRRSVVDPSEDDLGALIDTMQPDAVVCGTTCYESADRQVVRFARARSIPSLAVVDERYAYRARFANAEGDLVDLPDAIALFDADAVAEAAAEGLPTDRCHATGSPALSRLSSLADEFMETPPERPQYLQTAPAWPVVTFLSETFERDYGVAADRPGPLGPFVGYTETSVCCGVLETLRSTGSPVVFVEKLHPASDEGGDFASARSADNLHHMRVKRERLWDLLWHSDLVIGMRSIALLEADLLGIPAASFQPDLIGGDRCTAVRLGLIPRFSTETELAAWCRDHLHAPRARRRSSVRHPFAAADAADRVLAIALTSSAAHRA